MKQNKGRPVSTSCGRSDASRCSLIRLATSTEPWVWEWYGAPRICLMLYFASNVSISSPQNSPPLSVWRMRGWLNCRNNSFIFLATVAHCLSCNRRSHVYRVKWSLTVRMYRKGVIKPRSTSATRWRRSRNASVMCRYNAECIDGSLAAVPRSICFVSSSMRWSSSSIFDCSSAVECFWMSTRSICHRQSGWWELHNKQYSEVMNIMHRHYQPYALTVFASAFCQTWLSTAEHTAGNVFEQT